MKLENSQQATCKQLKPSILEILLIVPLFSRLLC
jgi:hypothetical protein